MRLRFITITLAVFALAAPLMAAAATANSTPGAISPQAGVALNISLTQSNDAGFKDSIRSLVEGTSPMINPVTPSDVFSPWGQIHQNESGETTFVDEFEFIINPSLFVNSADLDGDGNVDIASQGNPTGPAFDEPATLVRIDGDQPANQLWGDSIFMDGFENATIPPFGRATSDADKDLIDDLLLGLGLDPSATGPQDALGVQFHVAKPLINPPDYQGPITIWGGHFQSELGTPECSRSMYIYEFGRAFLKAEGRPWKPAPQFEKDFFTGISDATVIRCDGDWHTESLNNTGPNFGLTPTGTSALIFNDGFIAFTPSWEFANTIGYRVFSSRTPNVGSYQPENTFANTFPEFPTLMTPMPVIAVGTPFPGADHGPFPLQIDLISEGGGTESSPCPGDWSAIFELYLADSGSEDKMGAALYQFTSGQSSIGTLGYDGDQLSLITEGSGDGYGEMFNLLGPIGNYVYMPDGAECPYSVSIGEGYTVLSTAVAKLGLVPETTETEPTEAPSDTPGSGSSSPPSTPASSSDATADAGGFPWPIALILSGLALLGIGYGITRTGKRDTGEKPTPPTADPPSGPATTAPAATVGPCDRLKRMYEAAKADAERKRKASDDAETAADDAETKAGQADSAADDAESAAADAERDRKTAERNRNAPPPGESEAWIEDSDTGERITGTDLRLRREAAAEAWDKYQTDKSPESAAQTESDWSHLDDEGARAERGSEYETDQAARAKALADAEAAKNGADTTRDEANEARDAADQVAKDARAEADRLEIEAEAADTRAAELKRQLDECLGLSTGTATRWGGPLGVGEDPDGGCFPEGNIERRVLDTFKKTVNINSWVTVRPTSGGHQEAKRLAGELRWWRDVFGTATAALNVSGAVSGLTSRTVRDAVEAAKSGASVVAGNELNIDIPTVLPQVPLVVLEGAAATSATIIDAWGRMIENNHVEHIAEFGFQVKDVTMTWVEIWKCEGGKKRCVERVLEIEMSAARLTGSIRTETFQPREKWQPRVAGLARTLASRAQRSSQEMVDFMGKHKAGPC